MLDTARRRGRSGEGSAARHRLARADATLFDPAWLFGVPGFSRIFVSYSLSMIPGWRAALARALGWLPPGGELHVVDFGGQERLPGWFRAGLRRWLARFHVTPRDELEAELAAARPAAPAALTVFERPYGGYAQYAYLAGVSRLTTGAWPLCRKALARPEADATPAATSVPGVAQDDRSLHLRRHPHPRRPLQWRPWRRAGRRSRRPSHQGADAAQRRRRLGRGRRRDLWLRQPGGRGQPQRGAHGGPAGRPAGRGGGRHGQPPVRLGPRGGRPCGARGEARRGRHDDRRRRRGHDPLALCHGQARRPVRPLHEARGHRAGLALRQSAHEGGLRRRPDGPDRRERRQRAPDQPHRPGRLRLSQPAPLQGRAGSRLLRQGDRQGLRQEGQDRDHRRQGRASARRHHDGDAWPSCRRRSATAAR